MPEPEELLGIHQLIRNDIAAVDVKTSAIPVDLQTQLTDLKSVCDKILDIVDKK